LPKWKIFKPKEIKPKLAAEVGWGSDEVRILGWPSDAMGVM
jgi:hypothetical protein